MDAATQEGRSVVADENRWNALQHKLHEQQLVAVFDLFRSHDVEPILIKGWAAARLYPPGVFRHIGDIDIAVSAADHPKALHVLQTEEGKQYFVDLHREFRRLDSAPWADIAARSQLIPLDGTTIRIPSPEDHLRLLCAHWLVDGGRHKEKLDDIKYAVETRPADFVWDICFNAGGPVRRNWVITAIGVAHRYRGLSIDDLPFAEEARRLPSWIASAIEKEWKAGVELDPVLTKLSQGTELVRQLRQRFPPNAIRCTIEMIRPFGDRAPRSLQAAVFARRSLNLLRNLPAAVVGIVKNYVNGN